MRTVLALVVVLLAGLGRATAEKVDMSAAKLLEAATHAVIGKVAAVYERTVREGDWRVTHRVAELRVEKVEKGEGIVASDPLFVRYWTRTWAGGANMPPSTGGHRGLPKEGDRVRVYLARNAYDGFDLENKDGGYNVIGANGFEALPPAASK